MSPHNRAEQIQALDSGIEFREPWTYHGGTKGMQGAYSFSMRQVWVCAEDYQLGYDCIGMTQASYLLVLHELGHKLSPTQPDLAWSLSPACRTFGTIACNVNDRLLITLAEIDAWQWAIEHSLTPLMADDVYTICNYCLGSYFANNPLVVMEDSRVLGAYGRLLDTIKERMVL